ncbi:MAG: tol-pal system protein YbgF [Deltaproteobacteria bacterium]|nr:tol-pal system protein YbgF [Deltaproteobacteria bacterium]
MKSARHPMGSGKYFLPLLVFLVLMMPACVYDKEFTYLNEQVSALNRRVTQLQTKVEGSLSKELDKKTEQIHSTQRSMRLELDTLKGEIQELSGRLEDNENVLRRTVERDLSQQDAMRSRLDDLAKRVAALEAEVQRQREYLGLEAGSTQGEIAPGRKPGPQATPVAVEKKPDEITLYEESLALYREGRFEDAMEAFKRYLVKYPKSDRSDNAQFWIGECHMGLKQYEQAILAYQKVIKAYPKGNKVPSALLRQAQAFWEINDKTSARLLLKKIIKRYPKSSEAVIAKKRLAAMK